MEIKEVIKAYEYEKNKIEKEKKELKYKYDVEAKKLEEKEKNINLKISVLNECVCKRCGGTGTILKWDLDLVYRYYDTGIKGKIEDFPVCNGTGLNI